MRILTPWLVPEGPTRQSKCRLDRESQIDSPFELANTSLLRSTGLFWCCRVMPISTIIRFQFRLHLRVDDTIDWKVPPPGERNDSPIGAKWRFSGAIGLEIHRLRVEAEKGSPATCAMIRKFEITEVEVPELCGRSAAEFWRLPDDAGLKATSMRADHVG